MRYVGIVAVTLFATLAAAPTVGAAAKPRYCGTISYKYRGTAYRDSVFATGKVGCGTARRIDQGAETKGVPRQWHCVLKQRNLEGVCTSRQGTVTAYPYVSGNPSALLAPPQNCGRISYKSQGKASQDTVYVLGGSVTCATALIIDLKAESVPINTAPRIPGWQCSYDPKGNWVLCKSPTAVIRGVNYTAPPSPPPATPPPFQPTTSPAITVGTGAADRLTVSLDPNTFCQSGASPVPVTVRISEGGDAAQLSEDAQNLYPGSCAGYDTIGSSDADFSLDYILGEFDFTPSYDDGTHKLTYKVLSGSTVLALDHFEVDVTPARQIFDGTDDFINICLDGNYTLYSENLRLYCDVPASYYVHLGWQNYVPDRARRARVVRHT